MTYPTQPTITVIADELRGRILALINDQNVNQTAVTKLRTMDGSPQGVVVGSPGDIRVRLDVGEIWLKNTGIATTTGWVRLDAGAAAVDDFAFSAEAWGVPSDGSDAAPKINTLLEAASVASEATERLQRVRFPVGRYTYATDIIIPPNVEIWGDGPLTQLQQAEGAEIRCQQTFLRSSMQDLTILGQDPENQVGRGLVLSGSQKMDVLRVQIWYFAIGISLSDGTEYSAHHQIGPAVEVNVCPTGILVGPHCNSNKIQSIRIFYSFGAADSGVALDIDSATGLSVSALTVDSADTAVRVRNNGPTSLRAQLDALYLEPGSNPVSGNAGTPYDIDIPHTQIGSPVLRITGSFPSAVRGIAHLDAEGLHEFDMASRYPFGSRYSGSAGPKRNLIRNGMWNYFNTGVLPGVTTSTAPVPTWSQEQGAGDFYTGVRSLRLTPTGVGGNIGMTFQASDDGVRWITCGCRYRVLPGNVGFTFSATVQGVSHQYTDPEETAAGQWREGYVEVYLDPSNASRMVTLSLTPDFVNGTGEVLIDEIWAVEGQYAVASTQYGERIEMLPAPILISSQTLTGNGTFGPIDILNLPAVLGPPLDDFSAAPYGVVGAIYRFVTQADNGAPGTPLTAWHAFIPTVPGVPTVIADQVPWLASPQFSTFPTLTDMSIRTTSLSGSILAGDGASTKYDIYLVAWILQ